MDAIKLMDEKFSLLLIRRSLVQVQQGEPKKALKTLCFQGFFLVFVGSDPSNKSLLADEYSVSRKHGRESWCTNQCISIAVGNSKHWYQ